MRKLPVRQKYRQILSHTQVIKYLITGMVSNGIGYCFYLIATMYVGLGPKTAMTGLYITAALVNFFVNRRWTFRATASMQRSATRFLLMIIFGYFINLIGLYVCVDLAGWPHQLVQAGAIAIMTIYFYTLNKWYVHADNPILLDCKQ